MNIVIIICGLFIAFAGRQGNIIRTLTRALDVAVDALSNTFPGEYGKDIKNHNDYYLNKISEILEVKP